MTKVVCSVGLSVPCAAFQISFHLAPVMLVLGLGLGLEGQVLGLGFGLKLFTYKYMNFICQLSLVLPVQYSPKIR